MKIYNRQNLQQIPQTQPKGARNGLEFSDIYRKAVNDPAAVTPAGGIDPDRGLLETGQLLLEALGNYSRRLGDPGTSLRELAPLVRQVENAITRLESSPKSAASSELVGLMDDARATARVAVMKYHRGDYITD